MLHSICQQIWKTQQWPQDWKRSVFIRVPKKVNPKECSNYHTVALISHASKVMLKILQARLQQYMNHEFPDVQAGFREGRGTRDQIANICWIFEKAREFQKNIYFCFIDYAIALTVWITINWILKEMGIPDHLICLLRNLYAGQEATVRTGHGTRDWLFYLATQKYFSSLDLVTQFIALCDVFIACNSWDFLDFFFFF